MLLLTALTLLFPNAALQRDTLRAQPVVAMFAADAFDVSPIQWSAAPRYVLYADGTVIYRIDQRSEEPAYLTVTLSGSELATLLDSLALFPGFFRLGDRYANLPDNLEPPVYAVWAWDGSHGKQVALSGLLDSTARQVWPDSSGVRQLTPKAFINVARRLLDYRNPAAVPWYPTQFEIVLMVDDHSEPATPWPVDWPAYDGQRSFLDSRGRYHVPLTSSQVTAYLSCCRYAIFELGGKRWIGDVRPVLPGGRFWTP
jgi:hypothetical protein